MSEKRTKEKRIQIGKRFDHLYSILKITPEEMCKKSGVEGNVISRMGGDKSQAGSICKRDILKICRVYNINPEWLIDGIGNPFRENLSRQPVEVLALHDKQGRITPLSIYVTDENDKREEYRIKGYYEPTGDGMNIAGETATIGCYIEKDGEIQSFTLFHSMFGNPWMMTEFKKSENT